MKVKNPKSISKYTIHDVGVFSYRQIIFIIIGIIIMVGVTLLLFFVLRMLLLPAVVISVIIAIPVMLLGMLKISGLSMPKIIKRYVRHKLFQTETRKFNSPDRRFK